MRLRRLDLIAIGPFTGACIDLSAGHYGLHIVYGPNEAGKSSSLRALTDFLFGFEHRTTDNFTHANAALRVGGLVENRSGQSLHCIRRKANANSLRDAEDSAVIDAALWRTFLPDISRDLFTSMFGLTHESLRLGGEEIAKGGGKSGETLFASASGLTGLRSKQKELNEAIDELLSPSGRRGKVLDTLTEFKSSREQQKKATISVEYWNEQQENLQNANSDLRDINASLQEKRALHQRLTRIQAAIPTVAQSISIQHRLDSLADVLLVPEQYEREAQNLLATEHTLISSLNQSETDCSELRMQLQALGPPHPALDLGPALRELSTRAGAYRKGQNDLPGIELKLQTEECRAVEILRQMGRDVDLEHVERWRIPSDKQVRIEVLGRQYEGLAQTVKGHRDRLQRLRARLNKSASTATTQAPPEAIANLERRLEPAQSLSHADAQLSRDREQYENECDALTSALAQCRLPTSDWSMLLSLALPSDAQLEPLESAFAELHNERRQLDRSLHSARQKAESLRLEQSLDRDATIPTREAWQEARDRRDLGWSCIDATLQPGTPDPDALRSFLNSFPDSASLADAYAESVQQADDVAQRLLDFSEQVAKRQQLQHECLRQQLEIDGLQSELERVHQRSLTLESQWSTFWRTFEVEARPPKEMREWVQRAQACQDRAKSLRQLQLSIQRRESELEEHCREWRAALLAVGYHAADDERLAGLLRAANEAILRERGLRDKLQFAEEQRQRDLDDEREDESQLQTSESQLAEWRQQWSEEMVAIGLPTDALPEQASEMVRNSTELFNAIATAREVRQRIHATEREARAFVADVSHLAQQLDVPVDPTAIDATVATLSQLERNATLEQQKRENLTTQIAKASSLIEGIQQDLQQAQSKLNVMAQISQCTADHALIETATRSRERREADADWRDLQPLLIAQAQGTPLDEFIREVQSSNTDSLSNDISDLKREIDDLENRKNDALGMLKTLEAEVEKLDTSGLAFEMASQAEGCIARLEQQVEELTILRVCSAALTAGIERYRKKNQDPVLASASQAFAHMTLGQYQGLVIDWNEKGDHVLQGVRANRSHVDVEQMSDGTRDQLYLSLRLAALTDWNDRHEPIPLVVDDILVHFDDDRAVATLEQLVDLSSHTQVIFFTHHRHLTDLAKMHLPSDQVFLHEIQR